MNPIKQKIETINSDHQLTFDEKQHRYNIKNKNLISTTQLIKKYFPFDSKKVARQIAEKKWTSEEEILQEWQQIMNEGKYTHELIERYLKQEKLNSDEQKRIEKIISYIKENNIKPISIEQKIFSKEHGIAGTIDLICEINRKVYLIDWKTNRKNILKKEYFELANRPLENIPNNNFYKYSLQLSIYKYILQKQYNIDAYDTKIIHLINGETQEIDVLDMTEETLQILKNENGTQTKNI